ncbi:MAG: type 4a pilus biogenesis protein PilO [Nitrospirota bacterium]|nr:type 4a pilus biogenesis protein PilO [Nitrospirota bacterium]MDH5768955.1 type 4a pilus biogenesis protein PilO [Nitrospirota bacterium]
MAIKFDIKRLPPLVKKILSFLPAVIIIAVVLVLIILPKNKEIKALESKISVQENEIAKSQAKAGKLTELNAENERLKKRLNELKEQLPEEKEVSGLLKQVSDLGIRSGLHIVLWKPEQKKTHLSGIVYEIPVKVELTGSHHNLGYFFSSLTKLNRIVNISDIKLSDPKPERKNAILKIKFTATTFSALPEEELSKQQGKQPGKGK